MSENTHSSTISSGRIWKRVVLWTALFLCLMPLACYYWLMLYANNNGPAGSEDQVVVEIPKGTSVQGIGKILGEAGVIRDDMRFMLLARLRGVATKLRAGEFQLPIGKNPSEILELLVTAKPYHYSITIPEGLRGEDIGAIFSAEGWCDQYVFLELIEDPELIAELGFAGVSSLEGYLYPDTYFLTREKRGAKSIIVMLVNRFKEVWGEVVSDMKDSIPDQRETVILASIVEKETGDATERPLIASVFLNRLEKGMKLQSDPTVVYGSGNFNGPITKSDLKSSNPYNTYVIPALPAGPIASPGRAAIEAVLHPAEVEYLYFVSKNDGTHYFSKNLREHINAVNKYQRKNREKDSK
ncbi:endolytic transglycosylase MltG [Desulfopila aestuarii]|nr:endolytic transglycosylase MltG [Desulfopila aestuarii]